TGASAYPVTLVVDGESTVVHTKASSVADVLKEAGYQAGAHDVLAPGAEAKVGKDDKIVFNRGRQLRLEVDGVEKTVWTTARTVQQALSELGYANDVAVSVSRS